MRRHLKRWMGSSLAAAALVWPTAAVADSARSLCGYSEAAGQRPAELSNCTFSQRQGYITVRMEDGAVYDFSPVGESPGNYQDAKGNPVYRQRGLGQEGQLFKLPDRYLFVFWKRDNWSCDHEAMAREGGCRLDYGQLAFDVQVSGGGSLSQLRLTPMGLTTDGRDLQAELDGVAYRAEVADLDANGWPEVYVFVSSAGSGSYGSLAAWAMNNGKSMTPIYLPPLEQSPEAMEGYMGHDEFAVVENRLVRRFPVYREGDTNAAPSGGTRQLQYRLEPGEAGWLLVLDKVVEY